MRTKALLLAIYLTFALPLHAHSGGIKNPGAVNNATNQRINPATEETLTQLLTNDPLTAFGEMLVGQLHPQFQGSFEYTVDNTDLNANTTAGSGTVTQASGMAVFGTSTTAGSSALFQSNRHARYKTGLGGLAKFTALFDVPVAGTEQYVGIMDEPGISSAFKNGYSVGYNDTIFGFHRFQNDSTITIPIYDWDDPMDGSGASGMTIDQTKLNVYYIQYQYLGAGAINILVEDDDTGRMATAHTVHYANNYIAPSTHNPNFKFTAWVNNGATNNNIITKSASYAYFTEGKTSFVELHQPARSSGIRSKAAVTSEIAVFTIRNKSTYASKTNFIDIFLLSCFGSIEASSANNLGNLRIVKNATLGGFPAYSSIHATNSVVEVDTSGTTVTGGTEIDVILLAGKNDGANIPLTLKQIILAPGDSITIAGSSVNSAALNAQITWKELF